MTADDYNVDVVEEMVAISEPSDTSITSYEASHDDVHADAHDLEFHEDIHDDTTC